MKSNKEIVEIANEPSLWRDLMWISDHLSNLFYYPIIQGGGQELYEKESIQLEVIQEVQMTVPLEVQKSQIAILVEVLIQEPLLQIQEAQQGMAQRQQPRTL